MAKKKIIVSGLDDKKVTPVKKINKGLIKKLIVAAIVVVLIVAGVLKYIDYTNNYIGTVDGRKIYVYEFENELNSVVNEMEEEEKKKLEEGESWTKEKAEAFWAQVDDSGKSNRTKAKEKALERVVERKVKLSKAAERDIYLDNRQKKQIIREAEELVNNYMQYTGYDSYNKVTEAIWGMTFTQFKEQQGINWIIDKLDSIEKSKIEVSDDELKEWYEKNPEKYDKYVIKRIYISYKDSDDKFLKEEDLKKKQDLVAQIENDLKNGKDIGDLAKQYTEKDSEKSSGGVYMFALNEDEDSGVEEIDEWIKNAKVGDWTKLELKDDDDKVSEVYFVKYETKVTFDTKDEAYAKELRIMYNSIRSEVIDDKYDKTVKEWVKEDKYKVVFNKDIYEKFKVEGMHA